MLVKITIDDKTGHTVFQDEFDDESQFHLGWIDENGQYSFRGRLKIGGKGFTTSLRKQAQEWAKGQDIHAFSEELRRILLQESIRRGDVEVQGCLEAGEFSLNVDEICAVLKPLKLEIAKDFKHAYGKEGGIVLFDLAWQMMSAMFIRLKDESTQVLTEWEYPARALNKNEITSILGWLFRRM